MPYRVFALLIAAILGAAALTLLVASLVEPLIGGPVLPYAIPAAMALGLLARAVWRRCVTRLADRTLTEAGLAPAGRGRILCSPAARSRARSSRSAPRTGWTTSTCNACRRSCTTAPSGSRRRWSRGRRRAAPTTTASSSPTPIAAPAAGCRGPATGSASR